MAETKTKPTSISVDSFIDAIDHPVRRVDAKVLRAMMERASGHPAVMWGPSIVGFGSYHYRYSTGHEGDMCRIGFSPRKAQLVLYVGGYPGYDDMLVRLGKHKTSKACLYINKLSDVDLGVIEDIVAATLASSENSCASSHR